MGSFQSKPPGSQPWVGASPCQVERQIGASFNDGEFSTRAAELGRGGGELG
jgi:hypothetical protein